MKFRVSVLLSLTSYVFLATGHDLGKECVVAIPTESFRTYRPNCPKNNETMTRLAATRVVMKTDGLDAYIVPFVDVHIQIAVAGHDNRLKAVSGFPGFIGIGVITENSAALWTDGRGFTDADEQVDCGWEIYRKGGPNTTTVTDWIKNHMPGGQGVVGADPSYINAVYWENFELILGMSNISMRAVEQDIVEQVWTSNRPPRPSTGINVLEVKYAGMTWQDKLRDVRKDMMDLNVDALVTTGLDEINWLFNIRASDIHFEPYAFAFAIIDKEHASLYIMDSVRKLWQGPSDEESNTLLKQHLNIGDDGQCTGLCVQVKEYDHMNFTEDVRELANRSDIHRVMVTYTSNYRLYSAIPKEKRYQGIPPTLVHKARKNAVEREGIRKANLIDSVHVVSMFAKVEKEVLEGIQWTVYQLSEEAARVRSNITLYRDPSFLSLTGSGNTSVPILAYPSKTTSRNLSASEYFLLDSGGQYLDGTSDVTRTYHYGEPTAHEKEIYTRVLKAHLNLAMSKFPLGKTGREIDAAFRAPLWEIGVDYPHETGHGIAHYGIVVEGPARISSTSATYTSDVPFHASYFGYDQTQLKQIPDWADYNIEEHMCFSNEPAYYEVGKFGLRLENVVLVRKMERQNNFSDCDFLEFETVTLVPYEPHLIEPELLSPEQIKYIEDYHAEIWEKVSPHLNESNDRVALEWLHKRVTAKFVQSGANIVMTTFYIPFVYIFVKPIALILIPTMGF